MAEEGRERVAMEGGRRIGFAVDFSAGSLHALKWALQHMVKPGDNLILVLVNKKVNEVGEMHLWESFGSPFIRLADFTAPGVAAKYGVTQDLNTISFLQEEAEKKQATVLVKVYWGDAREKVCDATSEIPLDCLVMGSRGLGPLKRVVLGSVSNHVVNNAPCPVTVVKLPTDTGSS